MKSVIKNEFEIGDWVILNKSYIKELKSEHNDNVDIYINIYSEPQKIVDIYESFFVDNSPAYAFSKNRITKIENGQFRKATDVEIKKSEIKNIFKCAN